LLNRAEVFVQVSYGLAVDLSEHIVWPQSRIGADTARLNLQDQDTLGAGQTELFSPVWLERLD